METCCFGCHRISNLPSGERRGLLEHHKFFFSFLANICFCLRLKVLHFAAVATHNQDTAFMVAISFTAVNVIVSNFFIPFQQINLKWISWLKYISAMGYTFNGALQLEFRDRNFSCNAGRSSQDY